MMNTTLLASSAQLSATDLQELQLLHQIQNHTMSLPHAFLLSWLLNFPLPQSIFSLQARLNLYNILSSPHFPILSNLSSNPLLFSILIMSWPLWLMLGLTLIYLLPKAFLSFLQTIAPTIFTRFVKSQSLTFLELDFPAYTDKSAYATEQLYSLIHALAKRKNRFENLTNKKKQYSLEIVSTKNEGIRYLLVVPQNEADILRRSLLSYLPGTKIKEVDDYLTNQPMGHTLNVAVDELKLSSNFVLPLNKQKTLSEHDPISYLTGHMTSLEKDELVAFQLITTPILNSIHKDQVREMHVIRKTIYEQKPLTPVLQKGILDQLSTIPVLSILFFAIKVVWKLFSFVFMFIYSMFLAFIDPNSKTIPFLMTTQAINNAFPLEILNPYEQELKKVVKEKIDQQLFESTIRVLILGKNPEELGSRMSGIVSSFGMMDSTYQAFIPKSAFGFSPIKRRFADFQKRVLSVNTCFNQNPVLSASELSDMYHFPYTDTTKTENMAKALWKELPAPVSLKQGTELDVVFGENTYGNSKTRIGFTPDMKNKHMYIIGQTGMGKSTVMYQMIKGNMEKGWGVGIVDPHGDLAEDSLNVVPDERENDLIYFNPFDLEHNIHINLLELPEGLSDDELELEKELVSEGVISLFRREFSKNDQADAHRIEYILRNTIYTAFALKERTIFTIYDILNDPDFRRNAIKHLDDKNLINFWKNEFGRAGNYQIVKMVGGVTTRVGKYLSSPTAKRILGYPRSTISFDDIIDKGLILICNLSEGNLGEDTSQMLGTMIITKIHQAAMRRSRKLMRERRPFYLYVDEFQNFATTSFTRMLSSGRKFSLTLTIAEQSTAQQKDRTVVDVILTNVGHMICFKTAGPVDTDLMVSQFAPDVEKTDLTNLPSHHFYIKLSASTPEEPFSGVTLPITTTRDEAKIQRMIEASRKNWTVPYVKPEKTIRKEDQTKSYDDKENRPKSERKTAPKTGLPGVKKGK